MNDILFPAEIMGTIQIFVLQKRTKALMIQRTMHLGELVEALGADALPVKALAGILLLALEQAEDKPEEIVGKVSAVRPSFRLGQSAGTSNAASFGSNDAAVSH
ncbi:conjugal transfer protein TraD [Asaia sp. HN010]|uniref:conjugal transfer protein TraD n=1 Tax=Asaia sp. HN010 TaxID=3081233 RepID=UPI00301AC7A8